MVMAGGRVGELSVLTMQRPKAALPFAGAYRMIDFGLSNLMRAGINKVGILSQYRPASLIEHVGMGESWDFVGLDRSAKILPPFWGGDAGDWYQGDADAVSQNWNFVEDSGAEVLLILSGNHICNTDYRELIGDHVESGADMTLGFRAMPYDRHYGYGKLGDDNRLVQYWEDPEQEPPTDLGSVNVFVINVAALRSVFESVAARSGELFEFGRHVIPYMMERYRLHGHVFDGYWAHTRTIPSYYDAHRDLIHGRIDLDGWGVRTNLQDTLVASQPPAIFGESAAVRQSFISTGCDIHGEVVRSVLSPGVRVEAGARVVDSILCHNTVVERGAQVVRTISDKHVVVGRDTQSGPVEIEYDPEQGLSPRLTLLGKKCRIGAGSVLGPGAVIIPEQGLPERSRVEGSR